MLTILASEVGYKGAYSMEDEEKSGKLWCFLDRRDSCLTGIGLSGEFHFGFCL